MKSYPTIKGIVVSCVTTDGICNLTIDNGTMVIPYKIAADGITIEPGTLIEISFADGNVIISQIGV